MKAAADFCGAEAGGERKGAKRSSGIIPDVLKRRRRERWENRRADKKKNRGEEE